MNAKNFMRLYFPPFCASWRRLGMMGDHGSETTLFFLRRVLNRSLLVYPRISTGVPASI